MYVSELRLVKLLGTPRVLLKPAHAPAEASDLSYTESALTFAGANRARLVHQLANR